MAHQVKNLYNQANYIIKYQLRKSKYFTREFELMNILRYHPTYTALPGHTAQQTIKFLCLAWKGYFRSLEEWKKEPEKFNGKPRPPKYKKKEGLHIIYFTNSQVKIKEEKGEGKFFISFPKRVGLKIVTRLDPSTKVKFARLIPMGTKFKLEIVYEKEIEERKEERPAERVLALDLGVNNLVAGLTSIPGEKGFLINGRPIKAVNQWFNKRRAKLQSDYARQGLNTWGRKMLALQLERMFKIADYFHKASRKIVDYCLEKNIDTIVIGYNSRWKQKVNMGKKNNQTFVFIPFQSLIDKITYKAEEKGIKVLPTEESYTSVCSFLDNEEIDFHLHYVGKRTHRGLFISSQGLRINADINSAGNIGRKVFPTLFSVESNYGIVWGAVVHPICWKIS
ncbi:MAG: RNA-guided endonuclease InsQ/TnpB family protein [Candidatus Heimdallarchaeaceae archaeon]